MSLNGEDMIDLIPKDLSDPPTGSLADVRARLLAEASRYGKPTDHHPPYVDVEL
jgi:hypothetical protein